MPASAIKFASTAAAAGYEFDKYANSLMYRLASEGAEILESFVNTALDTNGEIWLTLVVRYTIPSKES